MDILKRFWKKQPASKDIKKKFLYYSANKDGANKALRYLKKICDTNPNKCLNYKKIFFTVFKDIETETSLQIVDQFVETIDDKSFIQAVAIRHKRVCNLERYEHLMKLVNSSNSNILKIEDIKKILNSCNDKMKLEKAISYFIEHKKENVEKLYKLIFSMLKDKNPSIAIKYGMLYFSANPFDKKFKNILLKRVKNLNLEKEREFIKKYIKFSKYIDKLLNTKPTNNGSFDKTKFQKELRIVANKVPSVFVEYYIEKIINLYSEEKVEITKTAAIVLKNIHTPLAIYYSKIYLNKNKHDKKFKKTISMYENRYQKEKELQLTINKFLLHKFFSIKIYNNLLSDISNKFENEFLAKFVFSILEKFPQHKNQILKNTFSILKDTHTEVAVKFGTLYMESNLNDIKFAKVLLKRLEKVGKNKEKIELAKKLSSITNDEVIEYIIISNNLEQDIQQCELLYQQSESSLESFVENIIQKYPKHQAHLLYRKLSNFYAKKNYQKAELYAKKSLELSYSEYVIKELYDLHMSYGHIQKAISVLPETPKLKTLITKRNNGESLYYLFKYGFDMPIKKISGYNPKKNKVFYLLHNRLPYNSGGYATRSHGLLTGVSTFGWEMHGVSRLGYPWDKMPDKKSSPIDIIDNITYHRLLNDNIGLGKLPLKDYLEHYANSLLELAQKEKPAIIHAASNYMNGVVGNFVAKCLGIPSVYEVRGLWEITRISREPHWKNTEYYNLMSKMEAEAAKGADIVFTLTEALRDEMVSRGVKKEKIHLLPNGVVSKRFSPLAKDIALAESLKIKKKTVVGFIGSFAQYEGLEYIVDAMEILIKKGRKDIIALMVGDGAVYDDIRTYVTNKGLDKYFIFTGRIPHDEVEKYYSLVDIVPLPRKGLPVCEMVSPLKPFEAMAMEKVVLSSDVAALAEIVKDGYNGLLFKKDNVFDLGEKIELLVDDPVLRERLGKKAREWVIKERDWNIISKKLDTIYNKMLK